MQFLSHRSQELFKFVQNAFYSHKLAHSYLIVGNIRGEGKTFAEQIVAMVLCEGATTSKPCCQCKSCSLVSKHEHRDMIWVEPQRKSRLILKEHIAMIRQHIFQTAFGGGWKAAVLLNAERMNQESSNMLLKTLEEPPPKSIFLLVAEHSEALLSTIVSRCQKIVLLEKEKQLSADERKELIPILKNIVLADGDVLQALMISKDFLKLLKTIREKVETELSDEDANFPEDDPEIKEELEKLIQARIEARYREERLNILNAILTWFRDFMLCTGGITDEKTFFFLEETDFIREQSKQLTFQRAIANLEAIEDTRYQLEQYLQEGNVFERLFVKLARSFQ
jgi:DNA polymerase-3 subunit delta'